MSVRVLSAEGDEFIIPSWCFVVGSKATSTLHTVCAKAAVHSSTPLVRLSQPLPRLSLAIDFMVEGSLPAATALSVSQWLELHRTSALLHYPTLRDAVEGVLLSLSRDDGSGLGRGERGPLASPAGSQSTSAAAGGLTTTAYMSRAWQELYSPSVAMPVTALGATGAFSLTASTNAGFLRTGSVAAAAQSTMLPDPFGFTRSREQPQ